MRLCSRLKFSLRLLWDQIVGTDHPVVFGLSSEELEASLRVTVNGEEV